MTVICYHGTSRINATKIKKAGFKPYTYFAENLADALFYGGEYIFEIAFPDEIVKGWQFRLERWYPVELIVAHYRLKLQKYYNDENLRDLVLRSNKGEENAKLG